MHIEGKTKLGFFPLPFSEAWRLQKHLDFCSEFCAIDPCTGDGVAFCELVESVTVRRHGIEIDAYRAAQSQTL